MLRTQHRNSFGKKHNGIQIEEKSKKNLIPCSSHILEFNEVNKGACAWLSMSIKPIHQEPMCSPLYLSYAKNWEVSRGYYKATEVIAMFLRLSDENVS